MAHTIIVSGFSDELISVSESIKEIFEAVHEEVASRGYSDSAISADVA